MTTKNQIRIEALKNELEKEKQALEKYHSEMQALMEEFVKKEIGKQQRDEELIELKEKIEAIKNTIPDFSEKLCQLYVMYNDMKNEYEKTIKFYGEIDKRMEKQKEEISSKEDWIASKNQRIDFLMKALETAKAQED